MQNQNQLDVHTVSKTRIYSLHYNTLTRNTYLSLKKKKKNMSKRQTKGWISKQKCILYVPVIFKLKSLCIINRHGKETYLTLLSNCRMELYQKNHVACSAFIWFHLVFQFYFSFVSFSFWFTFHTSTGTSHVNTTKWPSLLIDIPNE